jgi:flagellar hook-associated protein 3 FlgL
MSGGINPTGMGLASLLTTESDSISLRVTQLTEESSTGLVSQNYAGLGQGASIVLNLQPQVARDTTLQTGITNATGAMTAAQDALNQIDSITTGVLDQMPTLDNIDASNVTSVASAAQSALVQVADLLDTQYGASYIFAGQDSENAPVPDPSDILTSGFYTQINSAVSNLATNGAAATEAATLATASSTDPGTSPFSATLEALAAAGNGRTTIETGTGARVAGVMLANQNGDVSSTGNTDASPSITTGSYFRDILRGLATLASLTPDSLNASDVQTLLTDTQTSLNDATSAMSNDQGILGNRQSQLTTTATDLGNTVTALGNQVSDITQADLAKTATQLSDANTQLQASYQLIANVAKLSLVNYL